MRLSKFKHNCLSYTLERLHKEGGGLLARPSYNTEWWLHAVYMSEEGEPASYRPQEPLRRPLRALFGFDGVVDAETGLRATGPLRLRTLLVGAWLLALGTSVWVAYTFANRVLDSVVEHTKGLFARR